MCKILYVFIVFSFVFTSHGQFREDISNCVDTSDDSLTPHRFNVSCVHSASTRSRRQATGSSKGTCTLPPYPAQGTYIVSGVSNAAPGQTFESFKLTVGCRRGFGFVETDGTGRIDPLTMYCVNGELSQPMPECVRFCKLNPDPSVQYTCHVPGAGFKVCEEYVPPGTRVKPVCNTPLYYSTEGLRFVHCVNGYWDHVARCKAECGRVTPKAEQLVIGGERAKRGELPWHAGIYTKTTTPYMQICGGSLISNNVIISAAHCFWSDKRKKQPASNYVVAMGKIYRPWDNDKDFSGQKSDVKEIRLPNLFQGQAANLQEDIAALILTTPIVYRTYVRPVCVNFDLDFERWQLQNGKLGKVAGWGLTEANGKASPYLKSIEIPFINDDVCINTLPPYFREYITGDKFCAGFTNGTALCQGDSGGGLSFADKEFGIDRFYLRGVVSAVPTDDDKLCNDYTYTTFTRITKHEEFIKEALTASMNKTCPPYLFQCDDGACKDQGVDCNGRRDCADGSDEFDDLCVPAIVFSTTSEAPPVEVVPLNRIDNRYDCDPVPRDKTSPKNGQIAFDKCIEYQEKYLYSCDKNQTDGVKRTRKTTCPHGSRDLTLGGLHASVSDYTHRVTLGYGSDVKDLQWYNTGTIISEYFVLTAAQCIYHVHGPLTFVKLDEGIGDYFIKNIEVSSLAYRIKRSIEHPEYKPTNRKYNDIALLQTERPFILNIDLVPACLYPGDPVRDKQITAGGITLELHERTGLVIKISMQKLPDDVCKAKLSHKDLPQGVNFATQTCYQDKENSSETCIGDKGGALAVENPNIHCMYMIIGITSVADCGTDHVGVFTKVAPYIPWIESIVWPD